MSILGLDCELYYNTGSVGVPTWEPLPAVRDLTLNMDKATADVSSRSGAGWRSTRGTLKDASVDFGYVYHRGDSAWTKLKDDFVGNVITEYAVMDGDIAVSATEGLRIHAEVTQFNQNQPLEEGVTYDVVLSSNDGDGTNPPVWYTVP